MNKVVAILALLTATTASAQTLSNVRQDHEERLADALKRLHEQREAIQVEQLPLLRELTELEAATIEKERELNLAHRLRDESSLELNELRKRVDARQRELDFVWRTTIPNYIADYEASLSVGERGVEGEAIREFNIFLDQPDATDEEKLDHALALIEDSLEHASSLLGGKRYAGKALAPDGYAQEGEFLQLGPMLYFVSRGKDVAGVVETTRGLQAQVHALGSTETRAIVALAENGSASTPMDLSLGDALALESVRDTLTEHLVKGGIWVYPILLFALVATVVAIIKSVQVFSIRHPDSMAIHSIVQDLRNGDRTSAAALAKAQPRLSREMLIAAVDHSDESTEMVEEVMYESMLTTQPKLERYLNVIAVTAAAAPLLGLLGTVTGIIKTFQLMTIYGAGDPRPLISGISEALITTELGLILAIPALVLHALLSRKVAGIMARLEKTAIMVVNGLARRRSNVLGSEP